MPAPWAEPQRRAASDARGDRVQSAPGRPRGSAEFLPGLAIAHRRKGTGAVVTTFPGLVHTAQWLSDRRQVDAEREVRRRVGRRGPVLHWRDSEGQGLERWPSRAAPVRPAGRVYDLP